MKYKVCFMCASNCQQPIQKGPEGLVFKVRSWVSFGYTELSHGVRWDIHFYILVCYVLYIWAICWQMLVEHIWYLSIWCFTSDLPVVYQWCIVSCTLPMVFFLVCFTGFISHYMSVKILSTLMLCLGHMWPVGRYLHGCDDPRRTVHSPVA